MSVQQLHCFLFCSFLSIERSLQVTHSHSGAVPVKRGASCMAVLQESLRNNDQGWKPSSINSDLFPACWNYEARVSTGMVPLPHLGSDPHCSKFCMAAAITPQLNPWPFFLWSHLTDPWCFAVVLTHTPNSSFRHQELLPGGHTALNS